MKDPNVKEKRKLLPTAGTVIVSRLPIRELVESGYVTDAEIYSGAHPFLGSVLSVAGDVTHLTVGMWVIYPQGEGVDISNGKETVTALRVDDIVAILV